ncbi:DUF2610 domain-containing protein [Neolewinella persica]|uniref:DUF2610 domain-containing protein n=1 Tax=Neolewinella persica TaxID=70998 RepID=UPI0003761AC2|nr:DUF2610 domain-containing protein [Neolewinella persica]
MKKFTIPCKFGSKKAPFDVFIGEPADGEHPLKYQDLWLRSERGGIIPQEVMDSFSKLLLLAKKNDVDFEKLSVYALEAANSEKEKKKADEKENTDKGKKVKDKNLSLLVEPSLLRQHYDDTFALILLCGPSSQGVVAHLVLLIRAYVLDELVKFYKTKDFKIDQAGRFGLTEYKGEGGELSLTACYQLFVKYLPQFEKNAQKLFSLLSVAEMSPADVIKYIYPNGEISEYYAQKKVPELKEEDFREWKWSVSHYTEKIESQETEGDGIDYLNLGYAKLKLGEFEEAILILSASIRISKHPYAYNNRGFCRLKLGDFPGALEDIQKSIELDENNSYAHKNLGKYYMAINNREQALKKLIDAKKMGYAKQYGKEVDQLIDQIVIEAILN